MTTHERQNDTERHRRADHGAYVRQLLGFTRGGYIYRDKYSDELDEHLYDEQTEFPETSLDVARVKAWTKNLAKATDTWFKCKRRLGYNDTAACFEEGEQLRREHWKQLCNVHAQYFANHFFFFFFVCFYNK